MIADNNFVITLLCIFLVIVFSIIAFASRCRSPEPAPPPKRIVPDPALPAIQDQAVSRLLRLPQFRRTLDGALFDYYRGACLALCTCKDLPYPHLNLSYGDKMGVAFETAGALEHYVAVQEKVGALLNGGAPTHRSVDSSEGC